MNPYFTTKKRLLRLSACFIPLLMLFCIYKGVTAEVRETRELFMAAPLLLLIVFGIVQYLGCLCPYCGRLATVAPITENTVIYVWYLDFGCCGWCGKVLKPKKSVMQSFRSKGGMS